MKQTNNKIIAARKSIKKNLNKKYDDSIKNEFNRIIEQILSVSPKVLGDLLYFEEKKYCRNELIDFHHRINDFKKTIERFSILESAHEDRLYNHFSFSCHIRKEANKPSLYLPKLKDIEYHYELQNLDKTKKIDLHFLRRNINQEKMIRKHINNLVKYVPRLIQQEISKIDNCEQYD